MCRLVAYAGAPLPADVPVFSGDHSLVRQSYAPRELLSGHVNADGHGVAWYRRGLPVRAGSCRPIWQAVDLRTLLASVQSRVILASVRSATVGIPVDESGNAPLAHGRWSFVLNGFVEDFRASYMRRLRAGLPDDLYGCLRGTSDTETLFLLAVAELRGGASPEQALQSVRDRVFGVLGAGHTAQLNMVLADPTGLTALRTGSVRPMNSLYTADAHPLAPAGVLVASEPFDRDPSWRPVPSGAAVTLRA